MQAYQRILPIIQELGAELISISPQKASKSRAGAREYGLQFPVLCDRGNAVARSYDLVFSVAERLRSLYRDVGKVDLALQNDDDSWELPLPGTFVLDRGGVVRLSFVEADYSRRMEPALIIRKLRQMARQERELAAQVSEAPGDGSRR